LIFLILWFSFFYSNVGAHSDDDNFEDTREGDQFVLTGDWRGEEYVGQKLISTWSWSFSLDEVLVYSFQAKSENESWKGTYTILHHDSAKMINLAIHDNGKIKRLHGAYKLTSTDLEIFLPRIESSRTDLLMANHSTFKLRSLNTPSQTHIAFGKDPQTSMVFSWVTREITKTSTVQYGTDSKNLVQTEIGTWSQYNYDNYTSGFIHQVIVTNLQPATKYYYRVGDANDGWSKEWSFNTATNKSSVNVTIFADINIGGSVGGDYGTWFTSLMTLHSMLFKEESDFVIQAGDISYCSGDQACWDHHFLSLEPLIAQKPYMVCMGNHDVSPEIIGYGNRFFMPGDENQDYFYSFNVGPVHFVAFSTELFFFPDNNTNADKQMEWMQNDLEEATKPENRDKRPWIVAFGHRPIYCTSVYPDCTNEVAFELQRNFEPLFFRYGVDLAYFGHIHSMEASYPIAFDGEVSGTFDKPAGTVHIVNGGAGQGFLGPFTDPQPLWTEWREHVHGYSRLNADLKTLRFDFVADNGTLVHTITLGQPFKGIPSI